MIPSDSEAGDAVRGDAGDDVRGEASEVVRGLAEEGEAEVPRINVEIPRCSAALGTDQFFVKLPNFLSVETRSLYLHQLVVFYKLLFCCIQYTYIAQCIDL